ncbi:MAG: hypothetical protein K2N63_11965 [Lachnospiraceae bacterium]|nr:hypothetical protein [Lachnospiraceae bacterium]
MDVVRRKGKVGLMFGFLKKVGKVNQLEKIAQELEMNMSNNYKDAAQENFKEFERTLNDLSATGEISEAQAASYKRKLSAYKQKLKNYTHKDQKVTWML